MPGISLKIVNWILHTFENNLEIKCEMIKYLNDSHMF